MRKSLFSTLLMLVLVAGPFTGQADAVDATYVTQSQLDVTKVLPPPPSLQSAEQQRDLAQVLAVQKTRTPAQEQRALADAGSGLYGFADVLGANFTPERLTKLNDFLSKVRADGFLAFSSGKDVWNRPRPFETSHEVKPIGELPGGSSYPSGNSTVGYLTGIVLANMVPEKSAALYARGREFGDNRVVLGVHYPSDIEAGRMAAVAVATVLLQSESYKKDFEEAKDELRRVLGL
jgi:acid phosphatase (class A)